MLHTSTRRLGAAVAATALSAGALVAVSAPAANAGMATNNYLCVNAVAGTIPVNVVTDVTLPPTAPAGFDVPADLLDVKNKVTIPNQAKALFTQFGVTKVDMTDFKLTLGEGAVGAGSLAVAPAAFVDNGNGTSTADINGKNAAFATPAAGTYVVSAPVSYALIATLGNGSNAEFVCTNTAAPTSVGTVAVAANESTTKAKPAKQPTPLGKKTKLKVVVDADNEVPSGKVKVKKGKKVVGKGSLNAKGKVTITLKKKLPKGKTVVKVLYSGDDYTESSRDKKVVIKVK
ncbi:Ig-like domain repeat protein [Nocardioides terrigena]|uniref:Ig-like domain repeat protein n=1 Tax=Nocardioides terrigena TaxID=424797 RepID=UPI000D327A1C|nr:Ig-like domain repeat protein [Nocardioides terrigena]